jgi:hypothetical protein
MPRKQKEFKEGLNGRKVWDSATDHVMNNLQSPLHDPVGASFRTDSMEDYRDQAFLHLADHSNLSDKTLERADWDKVYAYFKKVREGTL